MAPQPLGPWDMEHEASIILTALRPFSGQQRWDLVYSQRYLLEKENKTRRMESSKDSIFSLVLKMDAPGVGGWALSKSYVPLLSTEAGLSGSCSLCEPKNGAVVLPPIYTMLPQSLGLTDHQRETRGAF